MSIVTRIIRSTGTVILPILLAVAMLLGPATARADDLPRLLVCPNMVPGDLDNWPRVLNSLYAYKFYINKLDPAAYPVMPALVQTLMDRDVKIAVEMGGLVGWEPCDRTKATQSFANEQPKLQHLLDMGGTIDILVFDGPVSRTVEGGRQGGCEMGLEVVLGELVEVYDLYREWLPDVQIGLLVNFPNWEYGDWPAYNGEYDPSDYGDYQQVLGAVLDAMDAAGNPIAFLQVDNPYGYATGTHPSHPQSTIDPADYDWIARLRELEAQVGAHPGTEYCMIYNSELGGGTSNEQFHQESLAFAALYPTSGGSPAQLMFQSWYPYPRATTPEDVDFTFMNIPYVWLGGYPTGAGGPPVARLTDCRGYPNPFNPRTEIRFRLSEPGRVVACVYDMAGRRVVTLHEGRLSAGEHRLAWDGCDEAGGVVSSGLYICRIEAGDEPAPVKLVMLK